MNIAVVGTGYVGLVTGTCFAETGNNVICVDIDKEKVRRMQNGEIPIYEPDLDILFERNAKEGRLVFTTDLEFAISRSQLVFLALPTPPGEDGSADLSYVLSVAEQIAGMITEYKVIIDKSTVPVGTSELVDDVMSRRADPSLYDVVSNPEFLREGVAVDDFMKPDRVVIGTSSKKARKLLQRLYEPFVRQGNPILFMDERSAEMTKYAANSYLATRISFMNEVANLCEKVGANVDMVRMGIGSDSRIGKRFLFPGVGFGGSCFPKDVKALAKTAEEHSYEFSILRSVIDVNQRQRKIFADKISNYFDGQLSGKTISIWGLAFKPETDDIREAPALYIIEKLISLGAKVRVYDPEAMDNVKAIFGNKLYYAADPYDALEGSDALAIITEWSVFRTPDFKRIKRELSAPVIFDGRNLYDLERVAKLGFYYDSIGRNKVLESQNATTQ